MYTTSSLTNQFLIAMPGLEDPSFSRTVIYICEHSEHGAMGIVINRLVDIQLGEMLDQLQIPVTDIMVRTLPVYLGGPVQNDRGFVLHSGTKTWDSTVCIAPQINVTTSKDILEAIAKGEGPSQFLIALGYAGWAGGQIETEMGANSWLSGPASANVIFFTPVEQRWRAAASLLGIDMHLVTTHIGHA